MSNNTISSVLFESIGVGFVILSIFFNKCNHCNVSIVNSNICFYVFLFILLNDYIVLYIYNKYNILYITSDWNSFDKCRANKLNCISSESITDNFVDL